MLEALPRTTCVLTCLALGQPFSSARNRIMICNNSINAIARSRNKIEIIFAAGHSAVGWFVKQLSTLFRNQRGDRTVGQKTVEKQFQIERHICSKGWSFWISILSIRFEQNKYLNVICWNWNWNSNSEHETESFTIDICAIVMRERTNTMEPEIFSQYLPIRNGINYHGKWKI